MLGDVLGAHAEPQVVILAGVDSDYSDVNQRAPGELTFEHDRLPTAAPQTSSRFEQRPIVEGRIQNDHGRKKVERSDIRHYAMVHAYGMERISVQSRSVSAIGYDSATFELEVQFRSGRTYRYQQVPVAAYRLLLRAPSIGEFVNQQIKPRFTAKDVTRP